MPLPGSSSGLTRRTLLVSAVAAAGTAFVGSGTATAAPALALRSGSNTLNADFAWARKRALDWVQTGKPGTIPSYWAGLTNRPAFYSRDVAHQMLGAHLLGLDAENISMLKVFAASATERRRWYPLWAFQFDGGIYRTDYKSDDNFVREIPAVFELTEKGVRQYLWTANRAYVDDSVLWKYYGNSINAFVTAHDDNRNTVADEDGTGKIFQGVASYNEGGEGLLEAGDGIASQYAALVAYSIAQRARGDEAGARATEARASALRAHFEKNWWSASANRYIRGFTKAGARTNFGKENSWFLPMKGITSPGTRTNAYLDFVHKSVSDLPPFNIEAYTYLPETFFRWGRTDQAWKWFRYVADSRAAYPEVSYTTIGNIAEGLLGIEPNAPASALSTLPQLPSAVPWLELDHIPLGAHDLAVRHDGNKSCALTHHSGPRPLAWTAQFSGRYESVLVNGQRQPAKVSVVEGRTLSSVTITVAPGAKATAAA